MSVNRATRALPAVLLLAAGLAGCGSDQSGSQAGASTTSPAAGSPGAHSSAPPGTPACDEVWQDGAKIPRDYRGCVQDGRFVPKDALGCSSGQTMVRYADRFYGVLSGTAHEVTSPLNHDKDYLAAVRRCRA